MDNVAEASSSSGWSRLPFPTALGLLCNVGTFENTSLGGHSPLGKSLLCASSVLCTKFAFEFTFSGWGLALKAHVLFPTIKCEVPS